MSEGVSVQFLKEPVIFVSYVHEDSDAALRLADDLTNAGVRARIDVSSMKRGNVIVKKPEVIVTESDYLLLLVSLSTLRSSWIQTEWTSVLAEQLHEKSIVVVPIIVEACQLPSFLESWMQIDMANDYASGLRALIAFLQEDLSVVATSQSANFRNAPKQVEEYVQRLARLTRRDLRIIANRCLDASALRIACFDLNRDYDELRGETKSEKLISLLLELARDQMSADFLVWIVVERMRCVEAMLKISPTTD